jgi:hypothetical protein
MSTLGWSLSERKLRIIDLDPGTDHSSSFVGKDRPFQTVHKPQSIATDTETIRTADSTSASSWFPRELAKLLRLQSMTDDWHSSDVSPPNQIAIEASICALHRLSDVDLCPSFIAPSSDEGVCLAFESGERYADIECFNTGEVFAMTSTPNGRPTIWEVQDGDLRASIARISSFIAD